MSADAAFSKIMGEEVEPRRKFIEEKAPYAQNLDIQEVNYGRKRKFKRN